MHGEPGWEIVPEVAPVAGEVRHRQARQGRVLRDRTSTWCSARNGITHIILTGITTDVCVHTTMREANDRGYECLILSDCTGATDPANHAAALHMVTMQGGVFGCGRHIRRRHRRGQRDHADRRPGRGPPTSRTRSTSTVRSTPSRTRSGSTRRPPRW